MGIPRQALEVLDERELPFRLVTKGTTVVCDADLFTRPGSLIQVSLNTLDDMIARLEPGAPAAAARLTALHELASRGVDVRLQAAPWIRGSPTSGRSGSEWIRVSSSRSRRCVSRRTSHG